MNLSDFFTSKYSSKNQEFTYENTSTYDFVLEIWDHKQNKSLTIENVFVYSDICFKIPLLLHIIKLLVSAHDFIFNACTSICSKTVKMLVSVLDKKSEERRSCTP